LNEGADLVGGEGGEPPIWILGFVLVVVNRVVA